MAKETIEVHQIVAKLDIGNNLIPTVGSKTRVEVSKVSNQKFKITFEYYFDSYYENNTPSQQDIELTGKYLITDIGDITSKDNDSQLWISANSDSDSFCDPIRFLTKARKVQHG